jgi:hypothetical protein
MLMLICPYHSILYEKLLNRSRLLFSKKYENITPELLTKSVWVSTSLALILALPPIGLFMVCYDITSNILVSALIGFGLHFALFAISDRITARLMSFVEDQKAIVS